jgi:PAS domain S-box-containing protein
MADAIGKKLATFVAPAQHRSLRMLLADTQDGPAQQHITLQATDGAVVSILVAASLLVTDADTSICLVASDLTELEAQASSIQFLRDQKQALEESRAELAAANNSLSDSRRAALNVAEDAIVARRQAEEAIAELLRETAERQQSEEKYRSLFNTLIEGFCIIEVLFDTNDRPIDYRFLEINPAFEAQTGLHDAQGKRMRELAPEHEAHWFEIYGKVALTGESIRFVNEANALNRWYDVSAYRVGGQDSRKVAILFNDITAVKKAEVALKASEERLALALESGQMGLLEWDTRTNRLVWNDVEYRLLGLPVGEGNEATHLFFDRVHPDDAGPFNQILVEVMESGSDFYHELRITRADDGQERWLAAAGRLFRDAAGQPVKMLGVNFDITARKHAEDALKQLNEDLENRVAERTAELDANVEKLRIETVERVQAVEALRDKEQMLIQQSRQAAMGEMIGNIAHQWRQPLNTLGLTVQQLLLFYDMDGFTREFLESSVDKSMELIQHMSQTIDDFRNYFRPDKEKIGFKVQKAIKSTLSLIEDSFKSQRIGVELVKTGDPVIHGYRNEYAQVILNILNNARDVLMEREIKDPKVWIAICSENGRAVVTIADNAGGIHGEIMGKIFDPYFTTKGPQQGTGVGLFMSKTIIEKNMGGKLTVRNLAEGAEFRIEV